LDVRIISFRKFSAAEIIVPRRSVISWRLFRRLFCTVSLLLLLMGFLYLSFHKKFVQQKHQDHKHQDHHEHEKQTVRKPIEKLLFVPPRDTTTCTPPIGIQTGTISFLEALVGDGEPVIPIGEDGLFPTINFLFFWHIYS
jgi:hypothetical protein